MPRMVYSSHEMVGFVAEIQKRIESVTGVMAKRAGGILSLNEGIEAIMVTARKVHHRFAKDDYRHTESELHQILTLASWLVEQHARNLGGGAKPRSFDIDVGAMEAKSEGTRPAAGTYSQAAFRSLHGWPGEG